MSASHPSPTRKMSKTMYMHTLDGQPASCDESEDGGLYLYFVSNRRGAKGAKLAASRRQIDIEQQACIRDEWKRWTATKPEFRGDRPSIERYGYVRVEVR